MFGEEWMEFFKRESPFAYYCVLFIQFLVLLVSYLSYVVLCLVLILPTFMIYSGTKSIKIQLKDNKEQKKKRKQKENDESIYLNKLENNIKKKKK